MNPDDRVGDFQIVRQLGEGGMGTVYLARDERLDRHVALKVIAPRLAGDPEFQRRFESEARSAAAIDDPHAVPVFSAGSEGGRLFIAMRFIDGTDLRAVLAESGQLEPAEAVAILADVASALDAAHAAGFVHRDVKPANILLSERRGARAAYLTDFGLTKGLQAGGTQLTGTGQWIGTLDYVAPEQMTDGRVDARTDVYALGCVLYEALSGSVPFPGTDMQKMWGHVNEQLPASEDDEPLAAVVAKATEKDPDARFQSAGDLARAAAATIAGEAVPAAAGSVATGVAATGLQDVADPAPRTQTMKAAPPAGPGEQPTATMPSAAAPTERRSTGGDHGAGARAAAAIGGAVVLAASLIGAAVIFAGGSGGEPSTVVTTATESTSSGGAGEAKTVPDEGSPRAKTSTDGFVPHSQNLYSVEIPVGWEQETSDELNGNPPVRYQESVWRNPAEPNTSITVDAQTPAPEATPMESAEIVRAQTSQSSGYREIAFEPTLLAGREAARWVFQVPDEDLVDRRVDYFVNDCGVGIALLGSTSASIFGELAPTFHQAASSLTVPCGE